MTFIDPPLIAKFGDTLYALMICRVSSPGEGKQREESNDDQEVILRKYLASIWDGPVVVHVIAGTGSGELVDRKELQEAERLIEAGDVDLVLCEDLSRISRRYHAQRFCELAEDHNTRVIAINGDVDTGKPNWRMSAGFSAMRHELYNADTSRRIQRSQQNLFDQGGMCQHLVFGYLKEPGTKSDEAIRKDLNFEPIYREWFEKLRDGASFAEVADWLNEQQIPVGPHCTAKQWNGTMVGRLTRNPILKGLRERNRKVSKRINKSGKYRAVAAPPEMLRTRECPHLAFVEADLFDEVQERLKERNVNYRRAKEGMLDPRKGIPKKRTQWPAQHVCCGVCGRPMVCQGKKERRTLVCSGAARYCCWNSVSLNLTLAGEKLAEALLNAISELPGFDSALSAAVTEESEQILSVRDRRRQELADSIAEAGRQLDNLSDAVANSGGSATLLEKLAACEHHKSSLVRERRELLKQPAPQVQLPMIEEMRTHAKHALSELRLGSPEFARLMAQLVPSIYVYPFTRLDGGKIVLRARVKFDVSALVPDVGDCASIRAHYSDELVVDLFDPPQPERYREQIWELSHGATYRKERDIAKQLGVTQPVVQTAKKLQRRMLAEDVSDAYVPVTEPPEGRCRLHRHKHKRYQFDPLEGFPHCWPSR